MELAIPAMMLAGVFVLKPESWSSSEALQRAPHFFPCLFRFRSIAIEITDIEEGGSSGSEIFGAKRAPVVMFLIPTMAAMSPE